MADVVGMTIIKFFPYRTNPQEEWSNQYHLTGALPADDTAWLALFNALATQEKTLYPSSCKIVAAYGYTSDDPNQHAQWVHDLSLSPISGTYSSTGAVEAPGDDAGLVSWKTSRTNSRGKPIYLRKYFHGVANVLGSPDLVESAQLALYNAFATKLHDGSFIDGRTIRSRGHDETILSAAASPYITTRTLKRRGKRPS